MNTTVMIVGAGPYGISLAYELWRLKVPFVIAGQPFSLWFDHTLGSMSIRSDYHTSEIYTRDNTFNIKRYIQQKFPDRADELLNHRISTSVFRDYLRDVLKRLPFPIERQKVVHVKKQGALFVHTLEDGRQVISEASIMATGIENHGVIPEGLASLRSDLVLHSWQVADYENIKNKRLLVVGAGQSAAECAAHLSKENQVTWVMRKQPVFYSEPINLPKPAFKFILYASPYYYFLPPRIKSLLGKKFVETTMTPDMKNVWESNDLRTVYADVNDLKLYEDKDGPIKSDVLNESYDGVIAATGFRYRLDALRFLDAGLRRAIQVEGGIPIVNFRFETSVEKLYMVGGITEPRYGPAQRFMIGARHATLTLGRELCP
ncbi:NAD(P)-binding domain-containing protein [Cohnella sp. REN36]|uniref:NAD(P)-binding domain-containing protein n=1 Tax=Cohnella sp. REN36 TaxID=2887347 RepID=UPI001D14BEB3|nr:NAD(P)-binding domain-containing protein [Cohnella sp. REN36]MCC3372367.1 NAD(P)-binding domain-containing protein [Cohnella sp. REN36]